MNSLSRSLVRRAVQNDTLWGILDGTLLRLAHFARPNRKRAVDTPVFERALATIAPERTVKYGPFKGMRYPDGRATASDLILKTLASYERELHPLIERLCANDYSEIVDIGCA